MGNKANLAVFRGEAYELSLKPKDTTPPVLLTGYNATVSVTRSVFDKTEVATGTCVLLGDNKTFLITINTQSLEATHTAQELEDSELQGEPQGCPYAYYISLTPPGGIEQTYVWGHLYVIERS